MVLKTLLSEFPIDLTICENGQDAFETYKKQDFNLVFMDLQMPIMDGFEAKKEIRQYEKQNKKFKTPIFALSANAMPHNIKETRDAGFDGHIAKPIILSNLIAAIEEALNMDEQYQREVA